MARKGFEFIVSDDDEEVAYLRMPGHPGTLPGIVKRSLSLRQLVGEYSGPDVNIDFDKDNVLLGIEIVG